MPQRRSLASYRNRTAWLVSTSPSWLQDAYVLIREQKPAVTVVSCDDPHQLLLLETVPRLIWWHVRSDDPAAFDALERAATRLLQYNTVVSFELVEPTRFTPADVERLGYTRITAGAGAKAGLVHAREVLDSSLCFVPRIVQALSCRERAIAHALLPLIEDPTVTSTVGGWGRLLGYTGRAGPAALLKEYGLHLPALAVMKWCRILPMLDWTWRKREPPKIRIVAKRFGFGLDGNTRNLNAYCRRQTQCTYAELLALGPERVLGLLAEQAIAD